MINEATDIQVFPDWVEYRNHNPFGTQVVKVFQQLYVPRIMAYIEWISDGVRRRDALSLPLDEILQFCYDAAKRTGRQQAALVELVEGLAAKPSSSLGA